MSGVNKVMLVGRLGKDPEVRHLESGVAVANFSIATSETYKDRNTGEAKEQTEWHRIVFFNKLAEVAKQYFYKGQQIYIEGRLQTKKWQDKDNQDRYTTEIVAENIQMLGKKNNKESDYQKSNHLNNTTISDDYFLDDIPF